MLTSEKVNATRAMIRCRGVMQAGNDSLKDFAFKILATAALRDHGNEARPVVLAEL